MTHKCQKIRLKKLMNTKKLKNIKALLVDVDGIMTDGRLWMESPGQWRRTFNIYDGFGIKRLLANGYIVGIITGSNSEDIRERAKRLGVDHLYEGAEEKLPCYEDFLKRTGLTDEDIAYIGDDLPDVPILERVAFSASVPGAVPEAKKAAQYITKKLGGYGAVRELCELLLKSKIATKTVKKRTGQNRKLVKKGKLK